MDRNSDVVIDMGDDWPYHDCKDTMDTIIQTKLTNERAPPIEPAATASFWSAIWPTRATTPAVPRRPLPRTADARLAAAVPDVCPDGPVLASQFGQATKKKQKRDSDTDTDAATVLYLAYGSNMAASTFQGRRGIKPLSAVPVSAPTLRLTFDLPGLPYREPCFANTAVRKLPKVPKRPDMPDMPDIPDVPDLPVPQPPSTGPIRPPFGPATAKAKGRRPVWSGPLYGVVYEVTADDYAQIIATEGGGTSYQEVVVPCVAEQPRMGVPERPVQPPTAFLARTLWAPQLPDGDGNEGGNKKNDDDDDGDDPSWRERLKQKWDAMVHAVLVFSAGRMRPDPEYAQPSARYLGLLTTGAAEHELPDAYQAWLASLAPYEVTHWRQHAGALVLLVVSLPFLVLMLSAGLIKRDSGRMPMWAQVGSGAAMHGLWVVYDHVLQPLCGDGEHTEETERQSDERTPLKG